jgi:spore maturation protein SpmB
LVFEYFGAAGVEKVQKVVGCVIWGEVMVLIFGEIWMLRINFCYFWS